MNNPSLDPHGAQFYLPLGQYMIQATPERESVSGKSEGEAIPGHKREKSQRTVNTLIFHLNLFCKFV